MLHRLLAPEAVLFTEMVTAAAVRHGPRERLLAFDPRERPVVLQLGGSEPGELAEAVAHAEVYGYAGYNLNCGCPSDRVQKGRFGACLMAEPERVRDALTAMREATGRPVTVKCRIAVDRVEPLPFLARFVEVTAAAGVDTFFVHARSAWLSGLSPRENREVPPLRYDVVRELKARRPDLRIVLNGGLGTADDVRAALSWADGVMIGREAYRNPASLPVLVAAARGTRPRPPDLEAVVEALADYVEECRLRGVPASAVLRHTLGLFNGRPGARRWRQVLSRSMHDPDAGGDLLREAAASVLVRRAA